MPLLFVKSTTPRAIPTALYTVDAAVVAAGTTQGTATLIITSAAVVITVPSGSGVKLASATVLNASVLVMNRGANALLIYPPVGSAIDALSTNVAYSLPAGSYVQFLATSTSTWAASAGSGAAGPQGTAGAMWYTGTSAPTGGIGGENDWYLNSTDGTAYQRTGGNWVLKVTLMGDKGDKGDTGNTGPVGGYSISGSNMITVSSSSPSNPTVNDIWIQI